MAKIQKLIPQLQNDLWILRKEATEELQAMAMTGTDISSAVPLLRDLLNKDTEPGSELYPAVCALVHHFLNTSDAVGLSGLLRNEKLSVRLSAVSELNWQVMKAEINARSIVPAVVALAVALRDPDEKVRNDSLHALKTVARNKWDIGAASEALEQLLHADSHIRYFAANALAFYRAQKKDWTGIISLLRSEHQNVRDGSTCSLDKWSEPGSTAPLLPEFVRLLVCDSSLIITGRVADILVREIGRTDSLAALLAFEKLLEKKMEEAKQSISFPQFVSKKVRGTRIAQCVAERKAKLAREKDRELLAGETIPKPLRSPTLYRAVSPGSVSRRRYT